MIDKLSSVSNMPSSRSEENVYLKHFQHLKMSQCWSVLQFYFGHFCLECLADVITNVCLAIFCCLADVIAIQYSCGRCYTTCFMSCLIELTWGQMLLPLILVTDVTVTCWYWSLWLMLLSHMMLVLLFGRCYAMQCNTTSNCCKGAI